MTLGTWALVAIGAAAVSYVVALVITMVQEETPLAAVLLFAAFFLFWGGVLTGGAYIVSNTDWSSTDSGSPASGSNCAPSYPDFCIPADAGDLDCKDVDGSDFTVQGSDPYGLDRDGDGVGCESY